MDKFLTEGIVPDVINQTPKSYLKVTFGNVQVELGNHLKIKELLKAPTDIDWPADPNKFYLLCLTDPDAPTRANPVMGQRIHWLVGNIPGSNKSLKESQTLIEYVPSCPGKGSGIHRYTFVLYEQTSNSRMDFSQETYVDDSKELWDLRRNFSIRKFTEKYNLGREMVHAGNFYYAEWDEDAQEIRRRLGLE